MKVWIYVEGPADRSALEALWGEWCQNLSKAHWGIRVIPLDDKSRFLRKIAARATEKLIADPLDLVVGLPDYYPNQPYAGTQYHHATLDALLELQERLVRSCLAHNGHDVNGLIKRFHASALKHDLEMLLLAACDQLRAHLETPDRLGNWRHPVEEQNQNHPPKRVVEALYLSKKGRVYRDTRDAVGVLHKVKNLSDILHSHSGQLECPVFKNMLDWIGSQTGVPAYRRS